MRKAILVMVGMAFIASSCSYFSGERVKGNGNVKKESRTVGSFTKVGVSGAIDLIVTQDSTRSVVIEADENLLQYIEVDEGGSGLHISSKNGYNLDPSGSIKVYVSSPAFTALDASGACSIRSENQLSGGSELSIELSGASNAHLDVKCPSISAGLSGASKLTIAGETKDMSLDASGSSNIEAFDLLSENADVELSGASHADIFASISIKADASGASGVRYKGNASVKSDASGASTIEKSLR